MNSFFQNGISLLKLRSKECFLIAFLCFVYACESPLYFEEPQPVNSKNKRKFKRNVQGSYLSLSDSSILVINNTEIIQYWNIITSIHKDQIDSTEGIHFENGQLTFKESKLFTLLNETQDSLHIQLKLDKTLFKISEKQLLRYFKGQHFLNEKATDGLWEVKILNLDQKGQLFIQKAFGGIKNIEEIKESTEVFEIKSDSNKLLRYAIKPNRKELKELLKMNFAASGRKFQKIAN